MNNKTYSKNKLTLTALTSDLNYKKMYSTLRTWSFPEKK